MNTFTNPWGNLGSKPGTFKRIQTNVPPEVWQLIRRLRIEQGTIVTVTNLLLQKLVNELQRLGITDYTSTAAFEHFVANCELRLPSGSTPVGPSEGSHAPSGRQPVTFGSPTDSQPANVTANVPGTAGSGGKPRRTGGKNQTPKG